MKYIIVAILGFTTYYSQAWRCGLNRDSTFDLSTVEVCYDAFLNHQLEAIKFKIAQEFGVNLSANGSAVTGSKSVRAEFHYLLDEALRLEQLLKLNQPCPVCQTCSSDDSDD